MLSSCLNPGLKVLNGQDGSTCGTVGPLLGFEYESRFWIDPSAHESIEYLLSTKGRGWDYPASSFVYCIFMQIVSKIVYLIYTVSE